ncbi:hypothetical protein MNV49_001771 [Pseudohyphozyma bogoriensis]|nr:hypothetical protein MNV49_001771 [Pseudohyphozyma bogoriensis]
MVHTVGLIGANGNLGAPTLSHLVNAVRERKINHVVLYRPGSKPVSIANEPNVEFRELDLETASPDAVAAAVSGLQVLIGTLANAVMPYEPKLIQALAATPGFVTYFPSMYSTTWTSEELNDPSLGPFLALHSAGSKLAEQLGVGLTTVYTSGFEMYLFDYGVLGSPVKGNQIWANTKQLEHRHPVSLTERVGRVLADLASRDPLSIKDTKHSVITYWPTGYELAELYTKINGKEVTIKPFTKEHRETLLNDGKGGAVMVGYLDKWENNSFEYQSEDKEYHGSFEGSSLEDIIRLYA